MKTDYLTYFYMGILWFAIGIMMEVLAATRSMGWFFLLMGFVYAALGLANREKWGRQVESPQSRRTVVALAAVLIAGILTFFIVALFRY